MRQTVLWAMGFVACWSLTARAANEDVIDVAAWPVGGSGVFVMRDFSGSAVDGTLKTYPLQVPAYDAALYISTEGRERYLNAANRVFPWPTTTGLKRLVEPGYKPDSVYDSPARRGQSALLKLADGSHVMLQPVAGPVALSHLQIEDDGSLSVVVKTFGPAELNSTDVPVLAWAKHADPYAAARGAWEAAAKDAVLGERFALREQKSYPEIFTWLGWCTWEQYRLDISSDLLVDAVKQIEASEAPIRWVLVDDGHQRRSTDRPPRTRMRSLETDSTRFPEGFKPLMALRSEKIKHFGIWHAMNGLWGGIDAGHDIASLEGHLQKSSVGSGLVPKPTEASARAFYEALIGSAAEHGFDFVKIDNQNRIVQHYQDAGNAAAAVGIVAQALEAVANERVKGLMNCFNADVTSAFNERHSASGRVSVDYRLNDEPRAKSHLYQSYQNTLWLGQVVWPDHDMFHSSDNFAGRMMAVSKAMSGAPVYLSDAPKDFRLEYIRPLTFADGRVLRPLAPAVPLPDSIFLDALNEAKPYRVIAPLAHGGVAIVAQSLAHPSPASPVKGAITADDYRHAGGMIQPAVEPWTVPAEGLAYFDWYDQRGGALKEGYAFTLEGFADRLVLLAPIQQGWAVIGRPDKFLCTAAVESIKADDETLTVTLVESGPLVVYSAGTLTCDAATKIDPVGENLWRLELPAKPSAVTVVVRRAR